MYRIRRHCALLRKQRQVHRRQIIYVSQKGLITWCGDCGGCGDGLHGALPCCWGPGLCGGGAWGDWAGGGPNEWGPGLAAGEGHCGSEKWFIIHVPNHWEVGTYLRVGRSMILGTHRLLRALVSGWRWIPLRILILLRWYWAGWARRLVCLLSRHLPSVWRRRPCRIGARTLTRRRVWWLSSRCVCLETQ